MYKKKKCLYTLLVSHPSTTLQNEQQLGGSQHARGAHFATHTTLGFSAWDAAFVSTQIKDRRSQPGLRAKLRLLNLVMSSGLQTRIARYLPPGLPGGSGVLAVCEKIKLMCM